MEPEGVVDVLRRLLAGLVPGGVVVDLNDALEGEQMLVGDAVLGELDRRAFLSRATTSSAGLDALVEEGILAAESDVSFPILVRYPSGQDAVDDVAQRTYTRMPPALAQQVALIRGPVAIRERSRVRSFRFPGSDP